MTETSTALLKSLTAARDGGQDMMRAGQVAAVLAALVTLAGCASEPTKEDRLIEFLDERSVDYSSRDDMIRLADNLCDLDTRGVDIEGFLRAGFSREDAFTIRNAVINGEYCE